MGGAEPVGPQQEKSFVEKLRGAVDPLGYNDLDVDDLAAKLQEGNSAHASLEVLSSVATAHEDFADQESRGFRLFNIVGGIHQQRGDLYGTIALYESLYQKQLAAQSGTGMRMHKGHPLVLIAEAFTRLPALCHSKRYLMLTLVEDSMQVGGGIADIPSGIYGRLVTWLGLPHSEFVRYATRMWDLREEYDEHGWFPEWTLQQLDEAWMSELPTYRDLGIYRTNGLYAQHLMEGLGRGDGRSLEWLAEYLLSCMPGCRTARRRRSHSTDYDVVCTLDGADTDFRSELGRCFICECKDLSGKADFGALAKFCRVLDSTKVKFGVVFCPNGITPPAERERLKMFHDRGVIIVVVTRNDLLNVAGGGNLVTLLRSKYDQVRLDLPSAV